MIPNFDYTERRRTATYLPRAKWLTQAGGLSIPIMLSLMSCQVGRTDTTSDGGGSGGGGAQPVNNIAALKVDLVTKTYGDSDFAIAPATCMSGSPSYSIVGAGLTLSGTTLHITGASQTGVKVTVTCPATGQYAAGIASYAVLVAKATPAISFPSLSKSITLGTTDGSPMVAAIVGTAGTDVLPVTYSSSAPNSAAVNGSSGAIAPVALGAATITASSPATANYNAATGSYILSVVSTPLNTVTMTAAPVVKLYGDLDFAPASATCLSGTATYTTSGIGLSLVGGMLHIAAANAAGASVTATCPAVMATLR